MLIRMNRILIPSIVFIFSIACDNAEEVPPVPLHFEGKEQVTITGYTDHAMEPFLSRDGTILLFNNSNDPALNTNLHWATRVDDKTFLYQGEIAGANSAALDGVATMDNEGNLYFVSLRDYTASLTTLFTTHFSSGTVGEPAHVANLSRNQAGWVNFDVEVDAAGETLYFVDGRFDEDGGPYEADLILARKSNGEFLRDTNTGGILKNINSDSLDYAASISADNLELYFTRAMIPLTSQTIPEIFVASRTNESEPFGIPVKIASISGFAEAPAISPDKKLLYYHALNSQGKFAVFLTRRIN